MAEKDIAEKNLESYNDVFADIVNVLIFGGKRVVKEKDLTDAKPVSEYNNEAGKKHYQERDVVKLWNNGEIRLSMLGIENQTKKDKFMPLRVMSYDAAAYRSQLLEKGIKQCYPIITLVLYFDTSRKGEPFNGSRRKVDHIIEIFNLLSVLSGSDKFSLSEEKIKEIMNMKGGRKMYMDLVTKKRFLDEHSRGFAKGRMEGRREGIKSITDLFSKLFSMGRAEDVERASNDKEYLKKLMEEYQK